MSKIKLTGNASGSGVLTATAPNTSTDRTITLPDSTGTILDNTSTIRLNLNLRENNDGNGIDIAKHPIEKDSNGNFIWIPELILGELLTSKNYNKKGKTTGGKNGFGFKLVLIYSKWGEIETVDHTRGRKYTQRFEDNLNNAPVSVSLSTSVIKNLKCPV